MPFLQVSAPPNLNGKGDRGLNHWYQNSSGPFEVAVHCADHEPATHSAMISLLQARGCYTADDLHLGSGGQYAVDCAVRATCTIADLDYLAGEASVAGLTLLTNP